MAPLSPPEAPVLNQKGYEVIPQGSNTPTFSVNRQGSAYFAGDVRIDGQLQLSNGGSLGLVLGNNEYLSGLTTSSAVQPLIGINSSDQVTIEGLDTKEIIVNSGQLDVNFSVKSEQGVNLIICDAGANGGLGALGFGTSGISVLAYFLIQGGGFAIPAAGTYFRTWIANTFDLTTTSGTSALITSLRVDEPNITIAGGATVTLAATVYISGAPTEASSNYALYVASGGAYFVNTVTAAAYSVGVQVGTSGTFANVTVVNGIVVSGS